MLIFLLLSLDFGGPCAVDFGLASDITLCLEQNITTVTDAELVKFIENVILYLKNSPYILLYMGDKKPPGFSSFSAFDTIGDLEKLKEDVKNNGGWVAKSKPVLHFYEEIFNIVQRLRDAHATVIFPFLSSEGTGSNFVYGLPYSFDLVPNSNTVMLTKNDFTDGYEASAMFTGGSTKVGSTISQIDFKKTGGTGPKQTLAALSEFASDLGFSSYDPHADFNSLFYSRNYFTSLSIFRPEIKFNPVVSLVGNSPSGTPDSFEIPWLGTYVGLASVASVDALSPLASASTNSHIKRKGNNEPPNWKLIKDSILKANLSQVLKNQVPDFITDRKKVEEKLEKLFGANEKIRSGRSVSRQMLAANEKMFANAAINLQPIKNDGATFEIYADDTNKIGYVRYRSFLPTDIKSFLEQFGAGFKDMVGKITQDGDVIIDVRGNGGGSVGVLEELIDFFFHSTIAPDDLEMDVLLTNASAVLDVGLLASLGGQAYHIVNGTKVPIDDTSVLATDPSRIKTKTHKNTTVNAASPDITANYTEHVFMDLRTVGTAEGNVYLGGVLRSAYGGYSPFSPQHLYIVSDGYCYSCCGMFTKLAVEMKSARVIGFGKHPTEDLAKYMPGSAAGTRLDASTFDSIRDKIEPSGVSELLDLLDMFPPRFERKGVNVAYTDMEAFSRNPAHANETLFFLNAPVQDVLPYQVGLTDEDLYEGIAANIQTKYITPTASSNFCFPGEVRVCEDHSSEHQVWGNQCAATGATGTFTNDCAFAYCEPGYFQTGVSPDIVCSLNSEGDDDDAGLIVSLPTRSSVFLLFAVAFTIVGLMFW